MPFFAQPRFVCMRTRQCSVFPCLETPVCAQTMSVCMRRSCMCNSCPCLEMPVCAQTRSVCMCRRLCPRLEGSAFAVSRIILMHRLWTVCIFTPGSCGLCASEVFAHCERYGSARNSNLCSAMISALRLHV